MSEKAGGFGGLGKGRYRFVTMEPSPESQMHAEDSTRLALTAAEAGRVLQMYAHERRHRVGRYVAVAGWFGLIRMIVAVALSVAFGVVYVLPSKSTGGAGTNVQTSDPVPLILGAIAPAALGAVVGTLGRAHVWVVQPKARWLFNAVLWSLVLAMCVGSVLLEGKHPRVLALLLGLPMTLVWIGFWAYSDKRVLPEL